MHFQTLPLINGWAPFCVLNAVSKAKVNAGDCIPIENAATGKFGLFRVEMLELL